MSENWCKCQEHRSRDFTKLTDFYCQRFIPTGWSLQYGTLAKPADRMVLYLTGVCGKCGGFMRTGVGIPYSRTPKGVLEDVCRAMLTHRPYAYREQSGNYLGGVPKRLEWYYQQDQLSRPDRIEQFTSLFRSKDQEMARRWADSHMTGPSMSLETSVEFFKEVIAQVIENGFWPEQSAFITCEPAGSSWPPGAFLSNGPFVFRPMLGFGTGGELRIDCYLFGTFDHSGRRELLLGTIKTACRTRDTCIIMGSLSGALLHYGEAHREANIIRYNVKRAE